MSQGLVYVFTGEGKGKTSAAIGTAVRAVGAGMKAAWVGFYKQESWKLSEIAPLKKLGVKVYLMGKGFHIKGEDPSAVGKQTDSRLAQDDTLDLKSLSSVSDRKQVKVAVVGSGGQVVVDGASEAEHRQAAKQALAVAGEILRLSGGTNTTRVAQDDKVAIKSLATLSKRAKVQSVDVLVMDEVNNAIDDSLIDLIDLIDLISKRGETHLVLTGRNACAELVEAADLVTEMKKVKHPYDEGKLAVRGLDF